MKLENIVFEKQDQVAHITLNRLKVLNALNDQTIDELARVIEDAATDESIRVVIITGAGDKAFAAGADIAELVKCDAITGAAVSAKGQKVFRSLETMGKPSIAAVNGFALGGGCELAMACSIRIASETARFGQPEVNLGLIPGYAGTQRLSRLVGRGIALDLILTGRLIDAAEALRIGLVSQVTAPDQLAETVGKTAKALKTKGPLALRVAGEAVDRGYDMEFGDACKLEESLFGLLCGTADMKEGCQAFLEKRTAQFKGR
jgi:enoyl-CoA hydratase